MNAYLVRPAHMEFLERYVKDQVERLLVYDIDSRPQ